MHGSRTPRIALTGIALIVLPLIAWVLKLLSFGWMMILILPGPIFVMIAGYALQIVIAAQGFLRSDGPLWAGAALTRATVAAWLSSVAFVVLGLTMPDGGDNGYGSTIQVLLGAYSDPEGAPAMHAATDGLMSVLAMLAAGVWIAGFLWLAVEWGVALVHRRRARSVLG